MRLVGILLAAGRGSRFGGNKLTALMGDGRQVVSAAAAPYLAVLPDTLSDLVAVVRPADAVLARLLGELGCRVVVNHDADAGIGASLAAGVRASAGSDGWLVGLADMPWLQGETVVAVADRLRRGASICAPSYQGRRGHPVGFSAAWREQLLALGGDYGARQLIASHPDALVLVATGDEGVTRDVDAPADLEGFNSASPGEPG